MTETNGKAERKIDINIHALLCLSVVVGYNFCYENIFVLKKGFEPSDSPFSLYTLLML